jgi:hypothetical protein
VVGKKKRKAVDLESPIDLASRIGQPAALARPERVAPEPVRRVDGPLESERPSRRPLTIGENEAPQPRPFALVEQLQPERTSAATGRPMMIGLEEAFAMQLPEPEPEPTAASAPLPSGPREAPALGEIDLVVTPLATPDDWHHFELALRRVKGVGQLRTEYYRAGILKLRVSWSGTERFARAVSDVPGYRIGILGEDRTTVQIRVAKALS